MKKYVVTDMDDKSRMLFLDVVPIPKRGRKAKLEITAPGGYLDGPELILDERDIASALTVLRGMEESATMGGLTVRHLGNWPSGYELKTDDGHAVKVSVNDAMTLMLVMEFLLPRIALDAFGEV